MAGIRVTLSDARQLRDEIRAAGYRCTVPLGMPRDDYRVLLDQRGRSRIWCWIDSPEHWEAWQTGRGGKGTT